MAIVLQDIPEVEKQLRLLRCSPVTRTHTRTVYAVSTPVHTYVHTYVHTPAHTRPYIYEVLPQYRLYYSHHNTEEANFRRIFARICEYSPLFANNNRRFYRSIDLL